MADCAGRKFRVYKHPLLGMEAVKIGFCWAAFFWYLPMIKRRDFFWDLSAAERREIFRRAAWAPVWDYIGAAFTWMVYALFLKMAVDGWLWFMPGISDWWANNALWEPGTPVWWENLLKWGLFGMVIAFKSGLFYDGLRYNERAEKWLVKNGWSPVWG